jgi:hypothetical protein
MATKNQDLHGNALRKCLAALLLIDVINSPAELELDRTTQAFIATKESDRP